METSLIESLQAYEEAHNRHDVQAVLAMCAEDIRSEVVGVWVKAGMDNFRSIEEWRQYEKGGVAQLP